MKFFINQKPAKRKDVQFEILDWLSRNVLLGTTFI